MIVRPSATASITGFTLLLIAAWVSACGSAGTEPTAGDAIVYVAAPLSGLYADAGQTALGGVRLAVEEINRSGGLLGHRLVVRALDDEGESNAAVANVDRLRQALRRNERIVGVIGHLNSGPTAAALPLYEGMGLVLITPAAGERSLTHRGHTMFFRVNASDSEQAAEVARFFVEEMSAQRVAIVHIDTEYGRKLAAGLTDTLQELGAAAAVHLELEAGQREVAQLLAQIRESAADAVFFAGGATEAASLRAGLVEAGVHLPMLASDGAFLTTTIDEAPGAADGLYVSSFAPSPRVTADASWIKAYKSLESREPGPFSINGYAAMQALAAGVRAANSFQGAEIAQAMRGLEVDTLLGTLRFSANGDPVDPQVWIYRVEGDEFRQIE